MARDTVRMYPQTVRSMDERTVCFEDPRVGGQVEATFWRLKAPSIAAPRFSLAVKVEPAVVMAPIASSMIYGPGTLLNAAALARCAELLILASAKVGEARGAMKSGDRMRACIDLYAALAEMLPAIAETVGRLGDLPPFQIPAGGQPATTNG